MTKRIHVQTDVGRLAVFDRPGQPGMPTIVLVHGAGFSSAVFEQQFLSERLTGFRLVAIDLPGHGASDRPSQPDQAYSFGGLASGIGQVINTLELNDCIICGWSLGGHAALELLDDEPLVAGAVISGTPPMSNGPLGSLRALHFTRDMLLGSKARFTRSDAERFERLCLGVYADGKHIETQMAVDPQARPNLARSIFLGQNSDQRALLLNATKPVCILQGEHDPLVRSSYVGSILASSDYHGRGQILAGAGHAPFVQAQSRFEQALSDFALDIAIGTDRRVAERASNELKVA